MFRLLAYPTVTFPVVVPVASAGECRTGSRVRTLRTLSTLAEALFNLNWLELV